jgi:hypothetical protein
MSQPTYFLRFNVSAGHTFAQQLVEVIGPANEDETEEIRDLTNDAPWNWAELMLPSDATPARQWIDAEAERMEEVS